ncbi:unnamed protein product [Protopolystoma xenopodis]|uniref:Katanin p80 subunit C-terminal domain-containing protein n=1 Tax=Protopolystoma xenopodis TaxID=117903 RepID=A0A3S5AQA8_9PLAT|nr:unnamed protein product [Protopolystoma xenopodis]
MPSSNFMISDLFIGQIQSSDPIHSAAPPCDLNLDLDDLLGSGLGVNSEITKVNSTIGHRLPGSEEPSEAETLLRLHLPHDAFMLVIGQRSKHLSTVRLMWSRSSIRNAIEAALIMQEPSVLIDILSVLNQNV